MKLTSIVPVLYVPDVSQGVRFYCDVLGFEGTGNTEGWACLEKNRVELNGQGVDLGTIAKAHCNSQEDRYMFGVLRLSVASRFAGSLRIAQDDSS